MSRGFIILQVRVDKMGVAIAVVCAGEVNINYHGGNFLPFNPQSFEGGHLEAIALKT